VLVIVTIPALSVIDIPVPEVRVLYSWVDPLGATPRILPAAAALVVLNPVPPFAGLRGVPNESDVALAAPRVGVTRVGLFANTSDPVPVSSDIAVASSAEVAWRVLLERLIVLLVRVSVVALPTKVSVLVGSDKVPVLTIEEIFGVVSVGEFANTRLPLPVSSVTAEAI
jgi:hypothetical protein